MHHSRLAKKKGNKVSIAVSGNGTGIPAPVLNKKFQPFLTTRPSGEPTGPGLAMSYDIITKSHEGELLAKSMQGPRTDFEIMSPI